VHALLLADANVWATALVGLLGVLVGAVVQGAREFVLARRQERGATVAAARLVNAELARAGLILAAARNERAWPMLNALGEPHAWEAQKNALALHLDDDDWPKVVWAYTQLDTVMLLHDSPDKPPEIDDGGVDAIDGALWHLWQANDVLRVASRKTRSGRAIARSRGAPAWAHTARPPRKAQPGERNRLAPGRPEPATSGDPQGGRSG
jgi:hypothetical protein